jgi:hypothetical protein
MRNEGTDDVATCGKARGSDAGAAADGAARHGAARRRAASRDGRLKNKHGARTRV